MKLMMKVIDERVEKIKNQLKAKKILRLTEPEYKVLKESLISKDILDSCQVLSYRGLSVKIRKGV